MNDYPDDIDGGPRTITFDQRSILLCNQFYNIWKMMMMLPNEWNDAKTKRS